MNATRRFFLLSSAALLAAGCATGKVVSGNYRPGETFSVNLGRDWSDVSAMIAYRPKNVTVLTVDGLGLNRLTMVSGLADGESIIRPPDRDTPRPRFSADMSDPELVEFVIDSIAQEYQAPESSNLRPQAFGAASGVRFDITTRTTQGLNVSGTALVAKVADKFNLMIFLAPSEYYYGQMLPTVEQIFASASI